MLAQSSMLCFFPMGKSWSMKIEKDFQNQRIHLGKSVSSSSQNMFLCPEELREIFWNFI